MDDRKVERRTELREWLQALAILGGALAAAYQFYFKEVLSPAKEPAALDLSVKLEKVGEKQGMLLLRATITAQNPTHRRLYVPCLWFTAYGWNLGKPGLLDSKGFADRSTQVGSSLLNRYAPSPNGEVVAQRRIVFDTVAWWDPSDKTNDDAIIALPKGKFDYVELRVYYQSTRDGGALDTADWSIDRDGAWNAQLRLKTGGGKQSSPLNYANPSHMEWAERSGAGFNWNIVALAL